MSQTRRQSTNNPVVDLKDVTIFQQATTVLSEVNLKIAKGEFCYLIGKTGSGKSSLLKTLYADLELKKGSGSVVGFDLTTMDRNSIPLLRRKLGIVFQDFNLLDDRNIDANLDFVLKATGWEDRNERMVRIGEVMDKVGLKHKLYNMPHELSGGEQQRIVVARALLNEPKLILADEPTGNLDPETSDEILYLLRDLSKEQNTAVILATHDYRILNKFSGRVIRCQRGRAMDESDFVF